MAQDLTRLLQGGQDVTAADDLRRAGVVVHVPSPRPASAEIAGHAVKDVLLPGEVSQAEALSRFAWLGQAASR